MRNKGGSPWVIKMKNALLKIQNVNVIIVDWHMGSRGPYSVNFFLNSLILRRIFCIII